MSTNHAAVAALPTGGSVDKVLLRNLLVARMPYVLADSDTPTDLVAVDPSTGATIVDILYLGRTFHYDPLDGTTANDGVSCLVSNEGRRYKLAAGSDVAVWAVLSRTPTSPPGSPGLGDAYLVPAGATGAWAGKANYVAVKTARGWEFVQFGIGRLLYVEDVDTFYRRKADGTWVAGLGASALGAGSVNILNVLGAKASFTLKVENRTTNTPPASPTAPTAYIIGPSPTGAWAGNAGALAICLVNGSFTLIGPAEGDQVYDKATQTFYTFRNSSWQAEAGAWVAFKQTFTQGTGSAVGTGGAAYAYSATTAPTKTANPNRLDDSAAVITHTARKTGALLRFRYRARFAINAGADGSSGAATIGLCVDSQAAAVLWEIVPWGPIGNASGVSLLGHGEFIYGAPDTNPHDYSISLFNSTTGASIASIDHRLFTLEEAS